MQPGQDAASLVTRALAQAVKGVPLPMPFEQLADRCLLHQPIPMPQPSTGLLSIHITTLKQLMVYKLCLELAYLNGALLIQKLALEMGWEQWIWLPGQANSLGLTQFCQRTEDAAALQSLLELVQARSVAQRL